MNLVEQKVLKEVRPMLINSWNLNNEQKCIDVKLSFAYFPKEYDGENPPRIRYDIIMCNGREQSNFNCSRPFVEMIDCIVKSIYEKNINYE
jgi:hypothetical protein